MNKPILQKNQIINEKYNVQFYQGEVNNGQIYRCKDNSGKLVRLKIYNAAKLKRHHFKSNSELIELEVLKSINHKNAAKFIDEGEFKIGFDEFKYIVTEFLSGESLAERLKRENPLPPYAAQMIINDVLEGIKYLHNFNDPIIHNAITPENIILDYKDNTETAIIINFHNARFFSYDFKDFEYDGVPIYFRASETFNKIITPRSDIFSVGALFYTLVNGMQPWTNISTFKTVSEEQLIERIVEERNKPLTFTSINKEIIDDHLKSVIKKALAENIDERFQSADEFSKYLMRELNFSGGETHRDRGKENKSAKTKKTNKGFSAIAGMEKLKDMLYNDVIKAFEEPEKYAEYGLTIPNGMLLYGPPGCGKTFFAEKLSEEVNNHFITTKGSDLASIYVHGTQEKIGLLFKEARENAPTIIYIDEFDALVPSRAEDYIQHHQAAEVNEFLAQMSDCAKDGIFIIASTNYPEKIDKAILRTGRIDKKIYVPTPDKVARFELFKLFLRDRPTDLDIDYELLAQKTKNYVSSDIKYIVDEAAREAKKSGVRISSKILLEIISRVKPSVRQADIERYEQLEKIFTGEMDEERKSKRVPFGFRMPEENHNEE